jgi:hypothetical protein
MFENYQNDEQIDDGDATNEPGEFVIPKKVVFGGLFVVVFFFLTFSGLLSRGFESKTIRFSGVSRTSYGTGLGFKVMFLRAGQVFTADYDTQLKRGGMLIWFRKAYDPPGSQALSRVKVSQSGSGQIRVPIPETGLYRLMITGTPDGDGYDLSYDLSWRAE